MTFRSTVTRAQATRSVAAVGLLAATLAIVPAAFARGTQGTTEAGAASRDTISAPAVGTEAPDFTGPIVWSDGRTAEQRLGALRGRVVVLAFYPGDRTSGCTLELSRFRDQFASLFGEGVTVLPVSLDDVASHASWSAEMRFPFGIISDTAGAIVRRYGSMNDAAHYANRTVYVIGKDGTIVWRELRFRALDENAYQRLAAAVKAAKER